MGSQRICIYVWKFEALNPKSEKISKCKNLKIARFGLLNFGHSDLFRVSILGFRIYQAPPDKTSFLATILTGKRLIPFRTQKLSPLRPMVVALRRE